MESLFADLAVLLRQEIGHYRRLLLLVRRERDPIAKGEIARLSAIVSEKERIVRELVGLEASRVLLLEGLASALGEPEANLTLGHVAHVAPGEVGHLLRALLAEFRGLIVRLVAANDINRTLLDRSLEFVGGSLGLFQTLTNANPTYEQSGRIAGPRFGLAALNQMA
jgi:flagellar biosynthesis/type III secretory pathway chaperone